MFSFTLPCLICRSTSSPGLKAGRPLNGHEPHLKASPLQHLPQDDLTSPYLSLASAYTPNCFSSQALPHLQSAQALDLTQQDQTTFFSIPSLRRSSSLTRLTLLRPTLLVVSFFASIFLSQVDFLNEFYDYSLNPETRMNYLRLEQSPLSFSLPVLFRVLKACTKALLGMSLACSTISWSCQSRMEVRRLSRSSGELTMILEAEREGLAVESNSIFFIIR